MMIPSCWCVSSADRTRVIESSLHVCKKNTLLYILKLGLFNVHNCLVMDVIICQEHQIIHWHFKEEKVETIHMI